MLKHYRLEPIAIRLAEDASKPPDRIQVIRTGTFHHPTYGQFQITKDHLLAFKKNFDSRVRGIDIALDYGHQSEGEAAAWFRELQLSDDGQELWAVPDWTPDGAAAVTSKKYRYVSADFNFDYQDNETLKKHGPTLLGAGLTNRPVVKGQAPVIELTEGKGSEMDPKDKEIADLKAKISELEAKLAQGAAAPSETEVELAAVKKQLDASAVACAELEKKIATLEGDKVAAEKKAAFDKKLSEGVVCEAQRAPFMSGDMDKFIALAQPIKLAEQGSGATPPPAGSKDVEDEVLEMASKLLAEKKVTSMVDGISMVLSEDADLRKRYDAKQV